MTLPTYVHIHRPPENAALDYLKQDLASNVKLSFGDDSPFDSNVIVLVSGHPTREEIARFPKLERLIIPWAGVPRETFDMLADRPNIHIHNLHHNAVPVAEYALMLMLAAAKNLPLMDSSLRKADWRPRYAPGTALLLSGKTALILGYGHIGRVLARYLHSFDMRVLATRRTITEPKTEKGVEIYPPEAMRDLLPQSDYLVIALPQTPDTEGLIGEDELSLLPNHAVLVNIGRGVVVDQGALFPALKNREIFAAGIDVWYNYPENADARAHTQPANSPFHELENIVMSPHRAGGLNTDDTERLRMAHLAVLLNSAARGEEMPNHVDRERGY